MPLSNESTFTNTSNIAWDSCTNNTSESSNNIYSSIDTLSTETTQDNGVQRNAANQARASLHHIGVTQDSPNVTNENTNTPLRNDNENEEHDDLFNINCIVDFLGDGLRCLTETISSKYAKITKDYKDQRVNGRQSGTNIDDPSLREENAHYSMNLQNSARNLQRSLNSMKLRDNFDNDLQDLNKRITELEETSVRHSILLNDSYKSHWLLMKRVRAIQNDVRTLQSLILQIKINQEKMWMTEDGLLKDLNIIKSNQEEIIRSLDVVEKNQNLLKEKHDIKTQIVVTENGRGTSSENDFHTGHSSRPNLSFYNFNCAVPNLMEVPSEILSRMIRSNESFKSTMEIYPEELEKLSNENKPSLCGLIDICNADVKMDETAGETLQKEEILQEDSNKSVEPFENDDDLEESKNDVTTAANIERDTEN